MSAREVKTGGKLIYDGKILKLHVDDVMLQDGTPAKREVVRHGGGAAIVAETDEGILFVEQFRYPYGENVLELPAGKRDGYEHPLATARRELEEETGYTASEYKFLGEVYPSPGYTDERLYLYLARGLSKGESHPDEGEFLTVRAISVDEVVKMIGNGEIKDAKTLIALLKYFCFYRRASEENK